MSKKALGFFTANNFYCYVDNCFIGYIIDVYLNKIRVVFFPAPLLSFQYHPFWYYSGVQVIVNLTNHITYY